MNNTLLATSVILNPYQKLNYEQNVSEYTSGKFLQLQDK